MNRGCLLAWLMRGYSEFYIDCALLFSPPTSPFAKWFYSLLAFVCFMYKVLILQLFIAHSRRCFTALYIYLSFLYQRKIS